MFTCSTLAKGIEVESSGTLTTNNCTINDSQYGINAKAGSNLSITGTGFFDNYIGVNLDMGNTPEPKNKVNILAFGGNTFATAQSAINPPYSGMIEAVENRGYCGIKLVGYQDFNVFGGNSFSALANGIIVYQSLLNIGNMSFTDMNSTGPSVYPLEGFGVHLDGTGTRPYWAHINELWTTMTFNNCKTGVWGQRYAAQVDNTVMTNVDIGIDWKLSPTAEIHFRKNQITARKYGIRSFRNEPFNILSNMDDNTITITTAGGGLNPVTGIEAQELGLGGNNLLGWRITNNRITMLHGGNGILYRNGIGGLISWNIVGNAAQLNDFKGIATENSSFTTFNYNNVDGGNSAGLGVTYGLYSSGGLSNVFSCNCFDNSGVGMQYYDAADFSNNVSGNKFNAHTIGLQIGSQGINTARIGQQIHRGNTWDLNAIGAGNLGGVNWGNPAQSLFIVNGKMGLSNLHPLVNPTPGWFISSPGNTFYCSYNCATAPRPSESPSSETKVPTNTDQVEPTPTDQDIVKGEIGLLARIDVEIAKIHIENIGGQSEAKNSKIQALLTENNAIKTHSIEDSNQKNLNRIVLEFMQNETLSLPSISSLETLANQCPTEGGDAVYGARALVGHFTGQTYFDDRVTCVDKTIENGNAETMASFSPNQEVSFFPNPTTGILQWKGLNNQNVMVRVVDLLGIIQGEFQSVQQQVDLSKLENGLYFVQLVNEKGQVIVVEKLSLLK
ncbi:MAG: T9SS type A sorting domain-containing protein [Saprospiraceae bacterium]